MIAQFAFGRFAEQFDADTAAEVVLQRFKKVGRNDRAQGDREDLPFEKAFGLGDDRRVETARLRGGVEEGEFRRIDTVCASIVGIGLLPRERHNRFGEIGDDADGVQQAE